MVNDIKFSNSFQFQVYTYSDYRHTDHSKSGIKTHYLAYMISGRCRIEAEDQSLSISEGDVFYIPKGIKYNSYWYGSPDIKFASVGFVYMPNFENKYYKLQLISAGREAIESILKLAKREIGEYEAVGELYSVLGQLIPNMKCEGKSKTEMLVNNAKKYISANPHATVSETARALAVSESALYLAFKKCSDKSINDYKISVLMESARDMLISSDAPIEEISKSLLFSSGSYFRKCFKEYFGTTPKDLRKKDGV